MAEQSHTEKLDRLLLPFVRAADDAESQDQLQRLITEQAAPVIRKVISRKLGAYPNQAASHAFGQEAADIFAEVVVQLLARLREMKARLDQRAIADFKAYVAVTAFHACDEHLRQKYPQRHRLKNRLRYTLNHHPGIALWEAENGTWLCGLKAWRCDSTFAASDRLEQLRHDPRLLTEARPGIDEAPLSDLVTALFEYTACPVELEHVVNIVAGLLGVRDTPILAEGDEDTALIVAGQVAIDEALDRRSYLRRLWAEICRLPERQRAALLMNLKDEQGNNAVALLPAAGVATVRQIAEALSMPAERLAEIWNEMPLDDKTIAAHLGVTRQQVINLRKSARDRLARRMRGS